MEPWLHDCKKRGHKRILTYEKDCDCGMKNIREGASKTFSVADSASIISRRVSDSWGQFDEDWGFRIHDIPERFRSESKRLNYIMAKKEESEQRLVLESKPYNVVIEPTNICNLHCPLCSTGVGANTRQKGTLNIQRFKVLIDQIKDYCLQLSLQNWGEPTLVKDLPEMIRYAYDNNVFVRLSTNLSLKYSDDYLQALCDTGIGRLVIDIDGITEDVYSKYRVGASLSTVLENARKILAFKKSSFPIVQSRMLVMSHNEHQMDGFVSLSKSMGFDEMEFGNIQINPNSAKNWLPKDKRFVYESYVKKTEPTQCHWPWSGMTINWNGGVSPCCIIDDANADFGNVFESSIGEVWNNDYYISARSEFSKTKDLRKHTICNVCKNDTHNPNLVRVGDTFSLMMPKNRRTD